MAASPLDLPVALEQRAPNRPIAWGAGLSMLAHLTVLLIFSVIGLESSEPGALPALSVFMSSEDGYDRETDNPPESPRSTAAQRDVLAQNVPAIESDKVTTDFDTQSGADHSPPPALQDPATSETSSASQLTAAADSERPADDAAPGETTLLEDNLADSETLTTAGAADRAVPALAMATPPREAAPQVLDISPAQQAALTRWVTNGVRGLRDPDHPEENLSWEQDGTHYTALFTRSPAADNTGIERVIVEIVAEDRGKRLKTKMQMKRLAFSSFTQLVDRWDTEVQLHDDSISGRFHSNTQILLGYDRLVAPVFLGKVTTAARGFVIVNARGRKRREDIFRGGIETLAGRIMLPPKFAPFGSDAMSRSRSPNSDIWSFTRDTRITFYGDSTYGWREAGSQGPEQKHSMASGATYIVGGSGASVFVRGTVRGKVLVYSPDRLVIEGNLLYASDPRKDSSSEDYLGLVSDKYVEIALPSVTGHGDLHIDGAVYAKRRFIVPNEDNASNATLSIYGSLTAGSLSATEPRYATRVEYDPRFEYQRPPGFPVTDRYEVESWDAKWEAADPETDAPTRTDGDGGETGTSGEPSALDRPSGSLISAKSASSSD